MEENIAKVEEIKRTHFYKEWLKREGIPVIEDYYIKDVKTQKLEPWKRKGGLGVYLNLIGTEDTNDSYICEIPPGKFLNPQRHLFEEIIYVVSGNGATSVWVEGGGKITFEWQAGSLFAVPLNAWHQHFNGSGDRPARYLAVTDAPIVMNLFHNENFMFNNNFVFSDRFDARDDYFSGKGKAFASRIWETNFIHDLRQMELIEWKERGAGGRNRFFEIGDNTMCGHLSEFPVGTYKKAHRHGPGAHVIIVKGTGYTLMWPEGSPMQRFDWQEGSIIVPPDKWFHQHFNTGKKEATYLAIRWGSQKYMMGRKQFIVDKSLKEGGDQIEYKDEDPLVRKIFEEALAKEGVESKMARFF